MHVAQKIQGGKYSDAQPGSSLKFHSAQGNKILTLRADTNFGYFPDYFWIPSENYERDRLGSRFSGSQANSVQKVDH